MKLQLNFISTTIFALLGTCLSFFADTQSSDLNNQLYCEMDCEISTYETVPVADTIHHPKSTVWKKERSKNCSGSDEDCMVWCLREVEPYIEVIQRDSLVYNETVIQSRKCVCPENITVELLKAIESKLIKMRYLSKSNSLTFEELNRSIKSKLWQYQQDHKLPLCFINVETLEHLGIYGEWVDK